MTAADEPAVPVKRPSHWARKRAAEKLRAERLADLAATPKPPQRPVNGLRQTRRSGVLSARMQKRLHKALRRGRAPMSWSERREAGLQ
jgi:hypothetical protein